MTLKEELEILRGEPIQVFTGDPMDIPCIETSDPERLCKHPVVSVNMITYNHEPYIRQAIEGVMMQKTDFEFELVIGEDCSTDKTREICFEYQKRYPDKIRVLWCDHNLYCNPHPAGGNYERNTAHCRGEFIALCEGDDYWIDPLKLQKQVAIMRQYPNVSLCIASGRILQNGNDIGEKWNSTGVFPAGAFTAKEFVLKYLWGVRYADGVWPFSRLILTASTMVRMSCLRNARSRFDIFKWNLSLSDVIHWLGAAAAGDVYCLQEEVSVYNQVSTGCCASKGDSVGRDSFIVRLYFFAQFYNRPFSALPNDRLEELCGRLLAARPEGVVARRWLLRMICLPNLGKCFLSPRVFPLTLAMLITGKFSGLLWNAYWHCVLDCNADPSWIRRAYISAGVQYRNDRRCSVWNRFQKAIKHSVG